MNADTDPASADDADSASADGSGVRFIKGDFTADRRLLWLIGLAIPIGLTCGVVAMVLQRLIGFFTNVFYYHSLAIPDGLKAPGGSDLGWLAILVPVAGGLIVGLMAYYGSDKIRGHGIPEAMEAILIGGSRMEPRVAVLKPLSSAISIGSGGPFGAEGPIIMTGGALGSIFAQVFQMTPAERKTLLVAGAAGGMAATFGTPIAAVLLAVELLLFEWKPRSFIPVAVASAAATLLRPYLGIGEMPMIPVPMHPDSPSLVTLLSAIPVGLAAGFLALLLTGAVHSSERVFHRLPIHWMWWPALGGIVVGIGGYFEPRALGVGYPEIEKVLKGEYVAQAVIGLMIVKGVIWSISLGSGTSGGVLAPLLMMGSILGLVAATVLPGQDTRLWALVGMGAILGGTLRSPLTGVVFAFEMTYDVRTLLPLLIATIVAYCLTVLIMKRSIMTDKIARRGLHVSQEYSVDPLDRLLVAQVMSADIVSIPAKLPIKELVLRFFSGHGPQKHQGYPVVDDAGQLLGVVTKRDLLDEWMSNLAARTEEQSRDLSNIIAFDLVNRKPVTIAPDETCGRAAQRMVQAGVGRLLVVRPEQPDKVIGVVTRSDLLKSRARHTEEEFLRERFLGTGLPAARPKKLPKAV